MCASDCHFLECTTLLLLICGAMLSFIHVQLRKLLLDTSRISTAPQFSEWDDKDALKRRCEELEQLVGQQREDMAVLRHEYRDICKKTVRT